jgi:hypothetical protein
MTGTHDACPIPSTTTLAHLERQLHRLRLANAALAVGTLLALAGMIGSLHADIGAVPRIGPDGVLEVRGLVVKDANGTPRVILGAPVPDPVKDGKPSPRIAPLSGLLILDHLGNERGGYGTASVGDYSEAFITLDDARGREVFTVVANADAGATLTMRNQKGAMALLTTFRDGPEAHLTGPQGELLARWPADAPALP